MGKDSGARGQITAHRGARPHRVASAGISIMHAYDDIIDINTDIQIYDTY